MNDCFGQYYRCPERYNQFAVADSLSESSGYFRVGSEIVYGHCSGSSPAPDPTDELFDALPDLARQHGSHNGSLRLGFDPSEIAENLRRERYGDFDRRNSVGRSVVNQIYYTIRPLLTVGVRKHLQRINLRGWERRPFPHWPVDRTVDNVFEQLLLRVLKTTGARAIPFIWFWPDGAPGAAVMTHDVETRAGRDFCGTLMDVDESFDIPASFQVVPEVRYEVP